MSTIGNLQINLIAQTARLNATMDRNARTIDGASRRMQQSLAGVRMMAAQVAGTLATMVSDAQIVRTIANFEQSMARVQAVSGASAEEMEMLTRAAREMGATTMFSASEAAEGLGFLAMAGFSAQQAATALPATLDLAAAGALDLGQAADIASNVLSGFRLDAAEATRVVDVMAAGASSANTSVEQLGQALSFAAPVAAGYGIDLETATAAIGALSNAGIQATRAGTGLNRVLSELGSPSTNTIALMRELGVAIEEIDPTRNAFVDIIERLDEAGAGAERFAGVLGDAFGREAVPALQALLGQVDVIEELERAMRESNGRAREMANIQANTLTGAARAFNSAIEEINLQLGDAGLLAIMRDVVFFSTDIVRVWAGMTDKLTNDLETVMRAAEGLQAALMVLGGLAVLAALNKLRLAILAINTAIRANPVMLVLSVVTTAVVLMTQEWEALERAFEDVWDVIVATAHFVWDLLAADFENIANYIAGLFRDMAAAIVGVLADVLAASNEVAQAVGRSDVGLGARTIFDAIGGDRGSLLALASVITGSEDMAQAARDHGFAIREPEGFEGITRAEESLRSLAAELAAGPGAAAVERPDLFEMISDRRAQREFQRSWENAFGNIENAAGNVHAAVSDLFSDAGAIAGDAFDEVLQFLGAIPGAAGPPGTDTGDGADAIEELERSLSSLMGRIDPVSGATMSLASDIEVLNDAVAAGMISTDQRAAAVERLRLAHQDALDPIGAFSRQMEEQAMLLRLDADARQLQVEVLRTQADLSAQLGRELTAAETAQIEALIAKNQALEEQTRILDELRRPQEEFERGLANITALFNAGAIDLAQFNRLFADLRLTLLDTQTDTAAGFERGFRRATEDMEDFATSSERLITDAFTSAQDVLVDFFKTGELNANSFFQTLADNFLRLGTQQLFAGTFGSQGLDVAGALFGGAKGGGLFGGGLFGGAKGGGLFGGGGFDIGDLFSGIGGLFGAQHGMDNTPVDALSVADLNGVDNRLVAFRARSDETVSVHQRGESAGPSVVININNPQDADSFMRSKGQIMSAMQAGLERAGRRNN